MPNILPPTLEDVLDLVIIPSNALVVNVLASNSATDDLVIQRAPQEPVAPWGPSVTYPTSVLPMVGVFDQAPPDEDYGVELPSDADYTEGPLMDTLDFNDFFDDVDGANASPDSFADNDDATHHYESLLGNDDA